MNNLEKVIDARVLLEEELRIKEQNVKERRNEVKRLNEIELQKQESMMNVGRRLNDNLDFTKQQGKSSTPRKDTDAEGAKINKNGSDYDIIIAKSSHDKDKTKLYDAYELRDENVQLHVFDSEETIKDDE
ncbi:hypothetical protein Tco_1547962 [Tanacetum coccineum]